MSTGKSRQKQNKKILDFLDAGGKRKTAV